MIAQSIISPSLKTPLAFDVFLHFGTLLAVCIYYQKDLISILGSIFSGGAKRRFLLLLLFSNIPCGLVGLSLKKEIELLFRSPQISYFMLIVTGLILLLAHIHKGGNKKEKDINLKDAFLIGLSQAFAIIPGISRSGATIATALLLGIDEEVSARFSFLMSLPAIGGATALEIPSILNKSSSLNTYLVGALFSCVIGVVSIHYLIRVLKRKKLYIFSVYCISLGIFCILSTHF